LETERGELSSQLETAKKELENSRKKLSSASFKFKEAQSQIDMLDKEKGVALRDNANSYEQFIQLQTQVSPGARVIGKRVGILTGHSWVAD